MATINFLYRSTRQKSFLTLRLLYRHNGKDFNFSAKTKILTDIDYWQKKHFSSSRDATTKNMQLELNFEMFDLEKFVLEKFEVLNTRKVNKEWLENIVAFYYNKDKPTTPEYLVGYADSLIKDLPYRVNRKGEKVVSDSRT